MGGTQIRYRMLFTMLIWVLVVQGIWIFSGLDATFPSSIFFRGDSVHFLEQARHIAQGRTYNANLPFHPPLTAWILVPLWWLCPTPEAVHIASKIVMLLLNALTLTFFFVLIRNSVPHAFWFCMLLPFSFGEMLLSSAVNSEAVYRFVLVVLLWLGFRRPFLGGLLNALACLTRAEHLWLLVLVCIVGLFVRDRRRFVIMNLVGCLCVLAPYMVVTAGRINAYNSAFKDRLIEPLPVLVPITLYGPLNFALAQASDDLFFSRSLLPTTEGTDAQLDPLSPTHNRYMNHGYSLGMKRIISGPGPWLLRVGNKILFSMRAVSYGWTWRDVPNRQTWLRPPVDMAHSFSGLYFALCLALIGVGAWHLRKEKRLLGIAGVLLLYRLGMNALFFPYLRSMMILSPLWLVLMLTGLTLCFKSWLKRILIGLLIGAGFIQCFALEGNLDYYIQGKSDRHGQILQDDNVTINFVGHYRKQGVGR
ncbi:hypothetical protein JXQ70_11930 [bacterium]|nr:hypothetical protein [bacterium]